MVSCGCGSSNDDEDDEGCSSCYEAAYISAPSAVNWKQKKKRKNNKSITSDTRVF